MPTDRKKQIDVVIAIVVDGGMILICQRRPDDAFGNLWEFPGGKLEAGETLEQCLKRELREELDLAVEPTEALEPIHYEYPHAQVTLHPFLCRSVGGQPRALQCQAIRWVEAEKLADYPFPAANGSLIHELARRRY